MAEFYRADEILAAARAARCRPATAMDAYTPVCGGGAGRRNWACGTRTFRSWYSSAGWSGARVGFFMQYYIDGGRLPVQRRRPAPQQLARVHTDHVRGHGAGGGLAALFGMLFLNGLPQAASSRVQCAAV